MSEIINIEKDINIEEIFATPCSSGYIEILEKPKHAGGRPKDAV
jgi:hypothetical protein